MNRIKLTVVAVLLIPSLAIAADPGDFYLGAMGGALLHSNNKFEDATQAGVVIGYDVLRSRLGVVSLEGTFSFTVTPGSFTQGSVNGNVYITWRTDLVTAGVAYRSPGALFLKARLNSLFVRTEFNTSFDHDTQHSINLMGVVGGGVTLGHVTLEAEWGPVGTWFDDETALYQMNVILAYRI